MNASILGLGLLLAYLVLVQLARWLYIARPNIVWNEAQSTAMGKRLRQKIRGPSGTGTGQGASEALGELLTAIDHPSTNHRTTRTQLLGWNGADQIGKWVVIHEAERLVLPLLSQEELLARLERALGQLGELAPERRARWEAVSRELLDGCDDTPDGQFDARLRAHLDELLGEVYEASNGKAAQLSGLYNRATWLVFAALLPLGALVSLGYGVVLVAGAIGGIVSRMQRLVFSRQVPMTYGSSWAPLFCAPVLGALAAWAGLMMISLLKAAGVLQLSALATELPDLRSPTAGVLGVAVILGLSERFLSRLEKQAATMLSNDGQEQPSKVPPQVPPEAGRPASGAALQQVRSGNGAMADAQPAEPIAQAQKTSSARSNERSHSA